MKNHDTISRRNFLKTSAAASGGLLIAFALPVRGEHLPVAPDLPKTASLNGKLRIDEDNTIHIILPKIEMGQGMWTTIPMLIAEELDCDWNKIKAEHSPPGKGDDFKKSIFITSTGGSDSTRSEFDRCRQAGAMARVMLVTIASRRLGVAPEACTTDNGFVVAGDKRLSYGELATEASTLPQPTVTLREPKDWKIIGKSKKRLDSPEKITGKAIYGMDIHFPGLLTAVVAHAPVFGGKVKSFDASETKKIVGVREVIGIPSGVAVIADNFWAAKKGRDALKIEWEHGANESMDSHQQLEDYRKLAQTKGKNVSQKGAVKDALEKAATTFEAEFTFPYLAHAPMEPLNCTVKISEDDCEVWTGTQSPILHQAEIAAFLGLPPERVALHTPHMGGSFGRRGSFQGDWVMEAVHIAKITGKFIKLVWSREDDIRGGYYRPVYLHQVKMGIGADGFPNAWEHRIVGQSLFTGTILEDAIAPNGIDYSSVTTGAPYSEYVADYSFELHTTLYGVPVLAWRSVGSTHTAFVVESLIDELASRAKTDPIDYRRAMLKKHPRYLAVLNLAAEKAQWAQPLPAGQFRGIAIHEAMGSCVCQIVELSIENQAIRLRRVVCVIDCGMAVNPDGVVAQMEGGIVYGLTAALYGEISLEKGQVQQSNFHDYPMLRMNEMPVIEVHIAPSTAKMGGAGEPGVPPIAPALANALFAATGKRIRKLPVKL
ncbi:molybdopterin cofactor-binding domain-containing protein [Dyadobacter pollutisoli]|uniref:Molybdopterin-dependent oxidoreductase n=1 Tax=Dyadobacter pollutisoli TaxID=2910158 RepID=A0A9E8SPE8_9BACT|nr:molybdopterin cofactor-binding domain-containing protein [Dyadobacter pollutisoli]WAC14656.1 molybdopterin-dependent oxidoreductase [Dyadobacter pollutisoli]